MAIHPQRIFQRRKQLGMSQEELAALTGTSQRQISKYETGKNDPTAGVLADLAQALQTTTDYLLGLTDISDRPLRSHGDLNEDERKLVELYRGKSKEKQRQVFDIVKVL